MSAEIDLVKFQELSGSLRWLPGVGAAFLRQLPQWRDDFAAALASRDLRLQIDLLHKIKGSCYAVAAYPTIAVIHEAEAAHDSGEPLAPTVLLEHLQRVEEELLAIISKQPAK